MGHDQVCEKTDATKMSYIKTNFYSTNHICATKHPAVNIHIITALSLSLLSAVRSSDTMPTVKCT